jgi:cytochrome P450
MDVDRAVATVRSWADAALESPVKYGAVAGSIALAGYLIYLIFIRHYFSSFYNLPGPPSSNWFWGNMREILEGDGQITTQFEWAHYGPTYRRWTIMGATEGTTFDFKAIAYMWQHPDLFHKPLGPNLILSDVLGKGLVTVEGAVHRRQRRVLNPAFGIMQIQGMAPMIFEKAYELRDRMQRMLDDSPTPGSRKFEMIQEVSDCSLDIIGMAGFDVDLGGISAIPNSLRETYAIGQSTIGMMTPLTLLQMQIPATRCFTPNKRTRIVTASRKIAGTLVAERKRQLAAEGTALEKSTFGKDVLSLLLKANMAPDLRDDQRLTDLEVVDQIATVLFAGHETTSTAMTWLLYLLSRHTDIQDRLRKELLDVDADEPDR